MKKCRKCFIEKPIEHFYKHKQMFDGHLNTCIDCHKKAGAIWSKSEKGKEFYKNREKTLKRRLWSREFQRKNRKNYYKHQVAYLKRNPEKYKARFTLINAIIWGKIKRQPCQECGCLKTEGHHIDYSKPLEVIWLCRKHHLEIHGANTVFI